MEAILLMAFAMSSTVGIVFGAISIVRKIPKNLYANILSGMNFFCGLCSVFFSLYFHNLIGAVVFIRMGEVFDILDGRAARKYESTPGGSWIDDISDMMSFGIAPGVIIWEFGGGDLIWVFGAIYTICVAWRLIRFIFFDKKRTDMPEKIFNGLPCPAGSEIITSICLISLNDYVLAGAAIFASILMVSHLQFAHFGRVMSEYVSRSKSKKKSIRVILAASLIAILSYLVKMRDASLFGCFFLFAIILYMIIGRMTAIQAQKNFKAQPAKLA